MSFRDLLNVIWTQILESSHSSTLGLFFSLGIFRPCFYVSLPQLRFQVYPIMTVSLRSCSVILPLPLNELSKLCQIINLDFMESRFYKWRKKCLALWYLNFSEMSSEIWFLPLSSIHLDPLCVLQLNWKLISMHHSKCQCQ